ncbi:MAG: hypothetical protein ACD_20C00297G0001 [uncultured bacterium]|nr:MAG: hypothetical protein ACD_20C00297G0001 [uncultured bacterium]HBH18638.1 hypothetical protein [Cyanobacteria bacterium UBA9579]
MDEWIKKYFEMLENIDVDDELSGNNLKLREANLFKDKHLPSSIFKYRSFNKNNHIENLKSDTIWLADPNTFNDPYDSALSFDSNKGARLENAKTF